MDVAIWNVLHDGRITSADGPFPGNFRLTVEIGYLCGQLSTNAKQLFVELRKCGLFEYRPFEGEAVIEPAGVAAVGLEILRAGADADCLIVECADGSYGGELWVRYAEAQVMTAEGMLLSQVELESASERYWEAWSRSAHDMRTQEAK